MSLTGLPLNTKYAAGDTVFAYIGRRILPLEVAGWEVTVDNPSGDGLKGRQITNYYFTDQLALIVEESNLFASKNHLRAVVKGDYINRAFESGTGGSDFIKNLFLKDDMAPLTFGSWTDFGGFDCLEAKFLINEQIAGTGTIDTAVGTAVITGTGTAFLSEVEIGDTILPDSGGSGVVLSVDSDTQLTMTANFGTLNDDDTFIISRSVPSTVVTAELIFDNANLKLANLPATLDTLSEFKAAVKSYDNYSTKWIDGGQILRYAGTGTVAVTNASKAVVGSGTSFTTEFKVGDGIVIPAQSGVGSAVFRIIESITDDTHLTVTENFAITVSGKTFEYLPGRPTG